MYFKKQISCKRSLEDIWILFSLKLLKTIKHFNTCFSNLKKNEILLDAIPELKKKIERRIMSSTTITFFKAQLDFSFISMGLLI